MSEEKKSISIWYFIGLLLTVYGVLITGAGIYDLVAGVQRNTVLAGAHAGIWWGGVLLVMGIIYIYFFSPGKQKR